MAKCMSCHKVIVVVTWRAHFFMITFILHSSCFCEIWELFVSWTTYDYLYYAPNLACWTSLGSLTSNVTITERAHCFHDYMYITLILLLWNLSTLCVVDYLWLLICIYKYLHIYIYLYIYISISISISISIYLSLSHSLYLYIYICTLIC